MPKLSLEKYRECLDYNPDTGEFVWRVRPREAFSTPQSYSCSRRHFGKVAGTSVKRGYIVIRINGEGYLAHRLAFLHMTGRFPDNEVDHINHKTFDNSWRNLRQVDRGDNAKNQSLRKRSRSGVQGVYWNKDQKKWHAQIKSGNARESLGVFGTVREAAQARKEAEARHNFHPNHGKLSPI